MGGGLQPGGPPGPSSCPQTGLQERPHAGVPLCPTQGCQEGVPPGSRPLLHSPDPRIRSEVHKMFQRRKLSKEKQVTSTHSHRRTKTVFGLTDHRLCTYYTKSCFL